MKRKLMIFLIFAIFAIMLCSPVTAAKNNKIRYTTASSGACDVVITSINVPNTIFKGHNITISNTIKNQGSKKCSGFYVDFFFRTSKTSTNIYIGSRYVNGLDPGASNSQNSTFKIPENITCTSYYVRVLADSTNRLNESNKTNNILYSANKASLVTGRPIYITSDNIKNSNTDNARMNKIVQGLKSLGLYAVNYGLGPNKHYSVLKNVNVPSNALIVNIYGGACAGTIWEMTQNYYKKALGTRKVFSIWINTAVNVGTVKFLKRSSDDNYTPAYGKKGGFPQFQDSNNNGIFEPNLGERDGISNPGTLLLKNGYHFIYQQNGDINVLVNTIYSEATK